MMIECKKVFLDTSPIIYFLDNNEVYGKIIQKIFENLIESGKDMISSVITCEEYMVLAYRGNNKEKENAFLDFVNDCNIPLYEINMEVAKKAAQIRAKYKHFKSMDALQLAVACITECDLFLSNDKQLRQFTEIRVITVDELKGDRNDSESNG